MSERGSFVTEYIYCKKCFEAVRMILIANALMPANISGKILADRISGLYPGEEIEVFENSIIPLIEEKICHPVRIAVLAEDGEKILTAVPSQKAIESPQN